VKILAGIVLFAALWQAREPVKPEQRYFEYQRFLTPKGDVPPAGAGPSCAVLDGAVYAHSATLADLRLYSGTHEVAYALSTSQTSPTSDAARVLNAGLKGGRLSFDLEMPARAYTDVRLDLNGQNFVATATVTGLRSASETHGTALGSFTLFDLSSTGLGRSTTLKLAESTFPYLHVELGLNGAGGKPFVTEPGLITGAEVPPSREAQTLYTPVAVTSTITQVGRHSVANFHLPAHVPVERVTFTLAGGDRTSFSRDVSVLAHANTANPQDPEARESVAGTITRIHLTEGNRELREEELSVPATLGANMDQDADVQVWVENGDDKPLALASVRLEMRQRLLCFDAQSAERPTLYYGDSKLEPPVYDYSRTFDPGAASVAYELSPESRNPAYSARPAIDDRTLLDRHPEILWLALLAVVGALGFVAFRSAKKI
jgi:hypothetical protein